MKKRAKALLIVIIMSICAVITSISCAEDLIEYFVMCQPDSHVWVREFAKKTSAKTGYVELGDMVLTDEECVNGYMHVYGITEAGEGWVHRGFLVDSEPVIEEAEAWIDSKGRVACRRYVNGTRRKWLHKGDKVVIYAWSEEWSLTNQGFIKTEFLSRQEIPSTATKKRR